MDIRFDGRTALVTGAGSGIGAQIARDLAASGARVVLGDIDEAGMASVATGIIAAGGQAEAIRLDVSDPASVQAAMAHCSDNAGGLHLLVNNAGITGASAPVGDYGLDVWDRIIGVNLTGVFLCLRFGLPEMLKAGGGAVVNVSSIAGKVGFAGSSAYVASKFGVNGLTTCAALEYADKGIRINAVGPGVIRTPLIDQALTPDARDAIVAQHPIGRMGEPEEVSSLTLFLLSDRASFITGSYHYVDGGYCTR